MFSLRIISASYYWYNDDNIPDIIVFVWSMKGYMLTLKVEILFSINREAQKTIFKAIYTISMLKSRLYFGFTITFSFFTLQLILTYLVYDQIIIKYDTDST